MIKMQEMKTLLVTGGAQGIGAAIVSHFAALKYQVFFFDWDQEAGQERQYTIQKAGGQCEFFQVDIRSEETIQRVMEEWKKRGVKLDVLVNNAGISKATPLEGSSAEWEDVIFTNLRGPYLVTKYAKPLLKRGSSIINISSTRAFMSEPHWHGYAAAKGGIGALTHSLAVTLGPEGIRVNAISPGWIDISQWKKGSSAKAEPLRAVDHAQHPVGRVGKPEDIAAACSFLASKEAGFITGANLVIDGGMTVKMIYEE